MKNVIQAYQGQSFRVSLESMLGSTNCGWCLMSMSEHVVLAGQSNVPVRPGIAPVNQNFYFIAIDDCQNPDDVILKFGLFNFSGVCSAPLRVVEFKVAIIPYNASVAEVEMKCGEGFASYKEIAQELLSEKLLLPVEGGWTPYRPLTEEDKQVFAEATAGWDGVGYTPLKVQSQVVAGVNYHFFCDAVTATREPQTFQAIVSVYKPLPGQGPARIMAIEPTLTAPMNETLACAGNVVVADTSIHVDDLNVDIHSTLKEFIATLENCKLKKGTYFSGTIYLKGLPANLRQAEVQGVIGYIAGDMLLDMTLTSTDTTSRWTCTYRTHYGEPKWVERK